MLFHTLYTTSHYDLSIARAVSEQVVEISRTVSFQNIQSNGSRVVSQLFPKNKSSRIRFYLRYSKLRQPADGAGVLGAHVQFWGVISGPTTIPQEKL